MSQVRIDLFLVDSKQCQSRSQAQDLIKRGFVYVNQTQVMKTSVIIMPTDTVEVVKESLYVSRGADKLEAFIKKIDLNIRDMAAYDIGASTGGFTQILLKYHIKSVETFDVGINQLDPSIRSNVKVLAHENTNILGFTLEKKDLAVIDVSFTSVIPILAYIKPYVSHIIVLVKPQFEQVAKFKDVIRNENEMNKIMKRVTTHIRDLGYHIENEEKSEVKGKKGNQEYFLYLKS